MKEKILNIIQDICPDVDFLKEKALIDDGIIDSFSVIQIITTFMDEFDIEIDADDIEPENLNSFDAMCNFVDRKMS